MLALVLDVKSYNFLDKRTGQNVTGSSVTFVTKQEVRNEMVYVVSKQSSSDMGTMDSLFPTFPAIYDITLEVLPSTGNRVNTKISKADFMTEIDLEI